MKDILVYIWFLMAQKLRNRRRLIPEIVVTMTVEPPRRLMDTEVARSPPHHISAYAMRHCVIHALLDTFCFVVHVHQSISRLIDTGSITEPSYKLSIVLRFLIRKFNHYNLIPCFMYI